MACGRMWYIGSMVSIKLLLVDDHVVVRQSLRRVLALQPGLVVVGEAGDGREAIERAEALRPDVVLMDAAMPGLGGIEATRRLLMKVPGARVVVLSQGQGAPHLPRDHRQILWRGDPLLSAGVPAAPALPAGVPPRPRGVPRAPAAQAHLHHHLW